MNGIVERSNKQVSGLHYNHQMDDAINHLPAYKNAVVNASPEDIVMTTRLSGTPAAVIRTPYIDKMGLDLPWYLKVLKDQKLTKKYIVPLIHFLGSKS